MSEPRAISIQAPWGECVMGTALQPELWWGLPKPIENRTWGISAECHRGDLWICAGKKFDEAGLKQLYPRAYSRDPKALKTYFATGVILGRVKLVDIVTDSTSPWAIQAEGMRHWVLEKPEILETPIAFCGRQGLMKIRDEKTLKALSDATLIPLAEWEGA